MGQQQLLLLVMGVIIASVAVVAGIVAFTEKMRQSEMENIISRNLEIATSAVFWKSKMDPFSGGNASYAGLATNGMKKLFMDVETHHAKFEITSATNSQLVISGNSLRYPDIGARTFITHFTIDSTSVSFNSGIIVE
ncbi:MAG: hypothetical protein O3B41_03935 [Bacteroidetes bacterium]|nr:hypothetical protein [Bacteroidota bacterium]